MDYDASHAVFAGRVVKIQSMVSEDGSHHGYFVTLRSERVWKGSTRSRVARVVTGGSTCGFRFEKGRRYLVYADRWFNSDTLTTGLCRRTCDLRNASEDLAALGRPMKTNRWLFFF